MATCNVSVQIHKRRKRSKETRASGVVLSQYRIVKIEILPATKFTYSVLEDKKRLNLLFEEKMYNHTTITQLTCGFEASELHLSFGHSGMGDYFPSDETFRRNTRDNFVKSALRRASRVVLEEPQPYFR